jgi:inner membrane protein
LEPVTHALSSVLLARAGLNRATKHATPMLLVAGLAADLDWLTSLGGASAFLSGHRTATHSLAGAAVISLFAAAFFWALGRIYPRFSVRFFPALLVCAAGSAFHLLLDLTNAYGVKLFWPFREKWFAGDLADEVDPWILAILVGGLLLPALFRLVGEEIGSAKKRQKGLRGAIVVLLLLALFIGARWTLHDRAVELMRARNYRGEAPLQAAAFPQPMSPFTWSGVVETEAALHQMEFSVVLNPSFDPDAGRTLYKPEPSAVLESARKSRAATVFLQFARFPKATVEPTLDGFRVQLRDLRFTNSGVGHREVIAVMELNKQAQVIHEELAFETRSR